MLEEEDAQDAQHSTDVILGDVKVFDYMTAPSLLSDLPQFVNAK